MSKKSRPFDRARRRHRAMSRRARARVEVNALIAKSMEIMIDAMDRPLYSGIDLSTTAPTDWTGTPIPALADFDRIMKEAWDREWNGGYFDPRVEIVPRAGCLFCKPHKDERVPKRAKASDRRRMQGDDE